ncbi:MAG TPA: GAF domain-containing protein [Chroococcales cyanobacterium]
MPKINNSHEVQGQPDEYHSLNPKGDELEWQQMLYDSLPCICFTLNPAGFIVAVSQFGATCLGYGARELAEKSILFVFDREDQVQCQTQLAQLLKQPTQTSEWSARLVRKNGTILWVKAIARVVSETQFEPIILLVCEDMTAHRQMEEALRESESLYQTTLRNISDTVFITDKTGTFTFISPNVQVMFGYSLSEIREQGNITKLFGEPLFDEQDLETYGEICQIEREITDKFGRQHTLLIAVKRVSIQGGTVLYSCCDITEHKQVEAALRQQIQRERLIGATLGRIHESLNLREILNTTVDEVRQFLECDRVIIFRLHQDGSGVVVVESVDSPWMPISGTVINDRYFAEAYIQLYQQGRVQAVEDIYAAGLTPCHIDLLAQFQVRANLVVPIVYEEKLWGLLVAQQCSETRQWQPLEIDLLKSLATQTAIAIQQSQLYEQAQYHFLREQALNQLTQAIRRSLDLQTIFDTATHEIEKLLKPDRVQIVQYHPNQKLWVTVAHSSKEVESPIGLSLEIPDETNDIAEKLKQLEVVRIDDTRIFEHEIDSNLAQAIPGAWLLVPLHIGGNVWGALGLQMNAGPYHWQDSEVELICEVTDQLAIALQQAELYKQSRIAAATARTKAQQLKQALEKLQKTQTQLVQSEKMSSLGQLVAGVAHEINNPINFIYGNLTHASNYIQDLLDLINLYQQQYRHPPPEIQTKIERIEFDFLIEDLPKLLESMRVGTERICEIVRSLRIFSRFAEADIKAVDIHEGLDSTLVILQNRLKVQANQPGIQVIKEYGNLPKVECYAGQLNQVFMNLFTNAIDAIDEQNQTRTPEDIKANPSLILVRTELFNDSQVVIRIADNGPGMTQQVQQQMFDPFFTTKPVGVGTGLGLAISYQIVVEKHRGQLHCLSKLGKGTEFVIQIPLKQSARIHEN